MIIPINDNVLKNANYVVLTVLIDRKWYKYNIDNGVDIIELVIRKPIFSIHEDFFINLLRVRSIEYPSIEAFKDSVIVDVENSITIEKTFKTAIKKLIKARKQFDLSLPKENTINVRSKCIQ